MGHRKSIDLDLFGNLDVDEFELITLLKQTGEVNQLNITTNIKSYLIDNIKVDIVNYPYEWISPCFEENRIRLAGLEDIAAMKLAAITGRGTKKDFVDIFFLLKKYSLSDMLKLYNKKFHDGSELMVLKSLSYFEDADRDVLPVMIEDIEWAHVKNDIKKKMQSYIKSN